jgi:hypothetical protein
VLGELGEKRRHDRPIVALHSLMNTNPARNPITPAPTATSHPIKLSGSSAAGISAAFP